MNKIKRIIPCLDVRDGKVVKGINFVGIKEVGDPVEYAIEYEKQGADEIVFLDINATHEGRGTTLDMVRKTVQSLTVPLVVGGGIRNMNDFNELIRAGASKASIGSAAIKKPELFSEAASKFGSKCVVAAIDGKKTADKSYNVYINGGRVDTGLDVVKWALEAERLGAGEILLTSMDADGTKEGFDIDMLNAVCDAVNIPVVASGGCGKLSHFIEVFQKTSVSAALAASVFHYRQLTVGEVKEELRKNNIPVSIL